MVTLSLYTWSIRHELGEEPHLLLPKGQGYNTSLWTLKNSIRNPLQLRWLAMYIFFEQSSFGLSEFYCI